MTIRHRLGTGRSCLLLAAALLLGACATALPPHAPQQAWIEVTGDPAIQIGADRLDGRRWPDRRYFQVDPGEHRLQVRLGFESGSGSPDDRDGGSWRTCILEVRHAQFAAGARYRLLGRVVAQRPVVLLQEQGGRTLARARVLRCGGL